MRYCAGFYRTIFGNLLPDGLEEGLPDLHSAFLERLLSAFASTEHRSKAARCLINITDESSVKLFVDLNVSMLIIRKVANEPTQFEKRLRSWQAKKGYTAKQAADFIGVGIATYRNWIYRGHKPTNGKCMSCIEQKLNE